jgi:malate dehydrogenase
MLARYTARSLSSHSRWFSSSVARRTKVAVLGAGGGIGQPLSLLLKADPLVTSLSLYDIRGAPGVAADVSHIDAPGEVGVFSAFARILLNDVVPGQRLPRRQTR